MTTFFICVFMISKIDSSIFIAINSLTENEAMASLGEAKSTLQARYHVAAQQALLNANLMKTLDIAVLQGYLLHLVCSLTVFYQTSADLYCIRPLFAPL